MDRVHGVDAAASGWLLYWNTHPVCALFSGKLHAQLDALRVVRVLLELGTVRARLLQIILQSQ